MRDRFQHPQGSEPNDPRRIFIPAPSGPPRVGGAPGAPPRPRPPVPPGSPGRVPGGPPGGPRYPGPPPGDRRAPGGPRRSAGPGWPPDQPPARAKRRRFRWRWLLIGLSLVVVLGLLAGFLWARSVFNRIERVEVSPVLSSSDAGNGTNYLIVGTDRRDSLQEGDPGFDSSADVAGARADTIMVLHFGSDGPKILPLPRDLFVTIAETGQSGKINAAYNGGPSRMVQTVQQALDVPVHRYMELDFATFGGLVDGLGGVTVDFEHPAFDPASGLWVESRGPNTLDGEQALAYARSRTYTEVIAPGEHRVDPTGDLGRIQRQQVFFQAVMDELRGTRNPLSLGSAASNTAGNLRIDDDMSMTDAFRFVWRMRSGAPELLDISEALTGQRNEAGAVLVLQNEQAQPILNQVR